MGAGERLSGVRVILEDQTNRVHSGIATMEAVGNTGNYVVVA